ncbi:MAG: PQQ-binding-like beta-propeller repeat protein [Gemmataceae bacterium]|nr:PQQ-binding-like beta-propeller repeat protein [Gemmataceae bacterium]MDW8263761.1 PQQ-binding-like beta-propeller repeat protein [Gemmataceae bacterium]
MKPYRNLKRWVSLAITAAVFGLVLMATVSTGVAPDGAERALAQQAQAALRAWAQFGGTVHRNMVNTMEKNMPVEWDVATKKNIKWVAALGTRAYGGPTIAGGKIFVGTNNGNPRNPKVKGDKGIVMCFRESDGQFLWQAIHDKLPSGQVNDWPNEGICSAPTIEGNRVYYTSNRCEIVCVDTEGFHDGKNDGAQDEKYRDKTDADIIWRYDMMKELNVFPHNLAVCSPLIVGDLIFEVTANGVDEGHINIPSPAAPSFIAVTKQSGKLVWQDNSPSINLLKAKTNVGDQESFFKRLVDQGLLLMHGQWSNPCYAVVRGKGQVIFPGGDGWLRAFEPETGKLLWKFDCNPKDSKYALGGQGTRNDFIATPVVHDNKLYIGVGQDPEHFEGVGHFWCIDLIKATEKGATNKDHDVSPVNDIFDAKHPANKDSALVWHYGGPADPNSGRDYVFGRTMSTCAVHDGLVWVAELAGYLHCLDAATGQVYWVQDLKSAVWGSPYWVDNKIYLGTEDGDVWIFAHGKEKKQLAKIEMPHQVKSTPIAVNGVLYVMTEHDLYAIVNK